ncbi:MAG: helix-turn-helix transcriptional regulator [Clostridiales bacterium]|nr:helix-turn-helix transcriptional regulator [Clostridiales bacterium]
MLELYQNIRDRRRDLGMSQEELAKKVGYTSRSTIARIEKGEIDLSRSKIIAFADALKTTPMQLMGWAGSDIEADDLNRRISFKSQKHYDTIVGLLGDPSLLALVERAEASADFRRRLFLIAKILENK